MRRSLLLLISSVFKWFSYPFKYLYHSIIPTKVNRHNELPEDYQEVNYIESSGTQWIDTGLKTQDFDCVESQFAFPSLPSGVFNICGTRNTNAIAISHLRVNNNYLKPFYGDEVATTVEISIGKIYNIKSYGVSGNQIVYSSGTQVGSRNLTYDENSTMTCSIFGLYSSGISYTGALKLYNFKMYKNNTLVRNFIPCYCKSDNVIGMYDTVNGVFYTNSGTGTFVKGADVFRNVADKAKIGKIEGNSEVENQLANGNDSVLTGIDFSFSGGTLKQYALPMTIPNGNHVLWQITFTGGAISNLAHLDGFDFGFYQTTSGSNSWKSLIKVSDYISDLTSLAGKTINVITTISTSVPNPADTLVLYLEGGTTGTFPITGKINITWLEKQYPFDTPTAMTDNRVQALINRGYIPFNTGKIKGTDIGNFESEPYNLFDGILEQGGLDGSNGVEVPTTIRCRSGFIEVLGATAYNLIMYNPSNNRSLYVVNEYDANRNFIRGNIDVSSGYFPLSNAKYLRFTVRKTDNSNVIPTDFSDAQICFNRKGTRTGYAPHTQPQTLPFKYQGGGVGTSHDTMEITNTEYIFTKDRALVDLGSINYTYDSGNNTRFYSTLTYETLIKAPSSNGVMANIICDKYTTLIQNTLLAGTENNAISLSQASRINIRNTSYTDPSLFKTAMSGVMLEYQLATPQVITIPRKHLGIKKISDFSWTYNSQYNIFEATTSGFNMKTPVGSVVANLYCFCALTIASDNRTTTSGARVYIYDVSQTLTFRDMGVSSVADFLNKYGDYYIYYETEDEVADIDFEMGIEAGGTLNANLFSWIRNQLVSNGNFADTSNWSALGGTLSASGNVGTYTVSSSASSNRIEQVINGIVSGHKYLICYYAKASKSTLGNLLLESAIIQSYVSYTTTKTFYSFIYTATASGNLKIRPYVNSSGSLSNGDTVEFSDFMIIDLTVGFPNGDVPTDINDYRIQKIINEGYIPTDTTGTNESVGCEVLPNVAPLVKCK